MGVIDEIAAERYRQLTDEGWDAAHDDGHGTGEIALAAATYAYAATIADEEVKFHHNAMYGRAKGCFSVICHMWPWENHWFKPQGKRRNLIKAAALIVAEIERLDRKEQKRAA